jgi:hypothetical protein
MGDRGAIETVDRRWVGFAAWTVVGAVVSFSMLIFPTLGLLLLAVAIAIMAAVRSTRRSAAGAFIGAGIPLLYVAWADRNGPGNLCEHTATSTSCGQVSDPWPWLLVGIALIVLGAAVHGIRTLRS